MDRIARRDIAFVAVAGLVALAGCGAKLGERTISDQWTPVALDDPRGEGSGFAYNALRRHRNLGDQVWRAPRAVEERASAPAGRDLLPAETLMKVEITIYPKISCAGAPPKTTPAKAPQAPAPGASIGAAEIARLGAPMAAETVWILAGRNVPQAPFEVGTEWLANFLRAARPGDALHFPAYQDCSAMSESVPERIPRRVFADRELLVIGARAPFTARLLEACRVRVSRHDVVIRSYHIPLVTWGYSIGTTMERTLTTARVAGHCPQGDVTFELGPVSSHSVYPHGDPDVALTSTAR